MLFPQVQEDFPFSVICSALEGIQKLKFVEFLDWIKVLSLDSSLL